jgi:hypothetical protein
MIDWPSVLTNALWICGLAVCVTALGYADWKGHATQQGLRVTLNKPLYQVALWGGLALVGLGAALSSERWWEKAAWGIVAVLAVVEVWLALRGVRRA